jgi:hypothetical protein
MSGGKGGSKTQSTEIPKWIEDPAVRNIARAEELQKIGYMPYYGPDITAFNPTQTSAMQQNIGAAEAFGLMPTGSLTAAQGMPTAKTYDDGTKGYSGMPLYSQALAELKTNQASDIDKYNKLFS